MPLPIVAIAWLTLLCAGSSAYAQASQQRGTDSQTKTRTILNEGVPASATVLVEVNGMKFRIPAGYLSPWPAPDMIGKLNTWPSLNFAFWFPEKRWVEKNPAFLGTFRPEETGRPKPGADEFVVRIVRVTVINQKTANHYITPQQNYVNRIKGSYSHFYSEFVRSDIDLLEINPPSFATVTFYRHRTNTEPQVWLECSRDNLDLPLKACRGHVLFKESNIAIHFQFPREGLASWKNILKSSEQLLLSWHNEAS